MNRSISTATLIAAIALWLAACEGQSAKVERAGERAEEAAEQSAERRGEDPIEEEAEEHVAEKQAEIAEGSGVDPKKVVEMADGGEVESDEE